MNPWEVQSIYDFNYFCCPECIFQSKEELLFQEHALQTHEQSKTFFQNSTDISNATEEDTYSDDHNFDEYLVVEPNTYCKTEVNSDPFTAENFDPLKEIKTELLATNNDLKDYYEKISENGENYESSGASVENEPMSKHQKQMKNKKANEENPNQLYCQFCPYSHPTQNALNVHVTRNHSDEILNDEICTEEIETKDYFCSKCNEKFNDLLKVWFTLNLTYVDYFFNHLTVFSIIYLLNSIYYRLHDNSEYIIVLHHPLGVDSK